MSDRRWELWLAGSLVILAMTGLLLKRMALDSGSCGSCTLLAAACCDVLVCFCGIGSVGLMCSLLFGLAKMERPLFWLFLLAILGAALHFTIGA